MDTETKSRPAPAPAQAPAASAAAAVAFTAVVLAPRWRLGRRACAKRSVAATAAALRPLARRVVIACQAAAAPAFAEIADVAVAIVPDSETPLSTLSCALEACPDDPLLVVEAGGEVRPEAIAALLAASREDGAGVVAGVDARGLLELPLVCRSDARPIVKACLYMGQITLAELLRRPCARLVPLD